MSILDLKMKLVGFILRNTTYLIVVRRQWEGAVIGLGNDEDEEHLGKILLSAFENKQDFAKKIAMNAVADYLKPLEIEGKQFIERIK